MFDQHTHLPDAAASLGCGALTALTSQFIFSWFAPPVLSRPDLGRRARALWIVSWPFFAVITAMLGVAVLVEPQTLVRRAVTIAAVGVLMIFLHSISRSGRPVLASWILVLGLSGIVTQRAWVTGGIHAPVAVFYALFILTAGLVIGGRGSLVTAVVCFLGAGVLTIGTAFEWLRTSPRAGSAVGDFVFVVLAIGLALMLQALLTFRLGGEGLSLEATRMLVHDMRTPMQIIVGHLELLRDNPAQSVKDDVEAALEGVSTLQRLTNSFLDVSRLEAGRMPIQVSDTNLSVLAHSVVMAVRVLQPTRAIAIEAHGNSGCRCDPELTRRIIENLVINAMKHTPIEGRVRVVTSGSQERASIAVHDEGPGVPAEKRTKIFEPYSAEGLRSVTGYASSGLGLAFCRLAVEAQGGTIRIEDATPHGSVFIVELPR